MAVLIFMLVITVVLCTAFGKPTCTLYSGKDMVCKPGGSDYVLSRGLVSDNNMTTGITLRGCRISSMDQESFENLRALQYLDLAENKLDIIELGVLDGLQRLTYLNLSRNLLTEFPLGLFDQTPILEVLDLKSNTINNLVLGIFDPMKNLRHLDLSDNKLIGSQISVYLFDQNPNIQFIDFSRNAMNDAKEILLRAYTSIDFLNLDRCSLTKVPDFTTKSNLGSMKHLMLSTNRISKITNPTTFVNLIGLEILNLAKNNIEELNENVFNPLRALRTVILLENRLKTIPDNLFQNMPKLLSINLGQNMLEDVPVNAFRGSPVKYLKLSHNRFTFLPDNFCLELFNSGAKLTKIFFNDNPWQCACLNDMLVEVKKFRIEYNAAKYKGQHPVCVTNKEFRCIRQKNLQNNFVELYDANVLAQ